MEFASPQPGDTIAGRYELLSKIGAGAFGAVFKARQLGIDRQVAIKLLLPEADSVDSTAVARFKREAKLSSSLEHPNTITIHDYGEWQGVLFLAMEYIRGVSLRQQLKKEGRLSPERAIKITRQVLSSLNEAHSRGIIHRDMKPANIMLFDRFADKDVVKVLDFGIAKFISNDGIGLGPEAAKDDLTVAGRIVGTPRYMAPEQVKGAAASPASDLYGLGLIFYEMLAGRRAVHGDSTMSLIAMQLSPQPVIDANDPLIPPALRPIILKATEKDPAVRYQSSQEFMDALETIDLKQLGAPPPPLPALSVPGADDVAAGPDVEISLDDDELDLLLIQDNGNRNNIMLAGIGVAVLLLMVMAGIGVASGVFADDEVAVAVAENEPDPGLEAPPESDQGKATPADEEPIAEEAPPEEPVVEEPAVEEPAVEEPKVLSLKIDSTPEGAQIRHGDAKLGVTPTTIELNPDEVDVLTLTKPGFEDGEIKLKADMDTEVALTLKRRRSIPTAINQPGGNQAKPPVNKPKPSENKPEPPKQKPKYEAL